MALQGKANQNDKILLTGRTNSTATGDTPGISFKHNKLQGYKTRIGSDTDYTTADDSTSDRRNDSNLALGNKGLVRSGGTGGNVKAFKSYSPGKDIFETATTSTALALSAHGQLLYVDGGAIKARMNPTTMTTHAPRLTNGGATGPNGDTAAGLGSYNSSVVFYAMTQAAATVATRTVTHSSSK